MKTKGKTPKVVFLFDVDNTLLNNDQVTADLQNHLAKEVGAHGAKRYWAIFEELRQEMGYADYLGALQRYRAEYPRDLRLFTVSDFLVNYPFANRLFANSLDAISHAQKFGMAAVLSDGDVVFQPRKIARSGIMEAVNNNVMIYVHKEHELPDVARRHPADHYVMVDDKLRILAAMKNIWRGKLSTVFVRQGHYALDPKQTTQYPPADITVERIGGLLDYDLAAILKAAHRKL